MKSQRQIELLIIYTGGAILLPELAGFLAVSNNHVLVNSNIIYAMIFCGILIGIKGYFAIRHEKELNTYVYLLRIIDLFILIIMIMIIGYTSLLKLFFLIIVIGTASSYEFKTGRQMQRIAFVIYILTFIIYSYIQRTTLLDMISFILVTVIMFMISLLVLNHFYDKERIVDQLESTNNQLNRKVAEFYTLQQLQNAINSIHDTEELINTVNDMIIGVIGPTYSSIVLKKSLNDINNMCESEEFELAATNMEDTYTKTFIDKECPLIWSKLLERNEIIETKSVDNNLSLKNYRINSFIAVPLAVKSEKIGMVVVEHLIEFALNEEHLRLVKLIAGDLSIALENTDLYEQMEKMATLDGLTMVYNRMYFKHRIEEEFKKAVNNYPISIAICDADFFKRINDNYGHIFGDKVLKAIAELFKDNVRNDDIVARYGGEEFVIIFPKTSLDEAYVIVERLRNKIQEMTVEDKYNAVSITMSFGIASYPEHGNSSRKVLRAADNALYDAKRNGRNCTHKAV